MTVQLNKEQISELISESKRDSNEICGFIINGEILYIDNVHEFPEHNFAMDYEQQLEVLEEFEIRGIGGIFHSHKNDAHRPSDEDTKMWKGMPDSVLEGWSYFVICGDSIYSYKMTKRGEWVELECLKE